LIADEIITGFRFQFGSLCEKIGIVPDLICLGKIIGGGLPVGAYAGRRVIMDKLAPLGNVYQASTFSGNPIVMQAGLTTLRGASKLKNKYVLLARYADYLTRVIRKESQSRKIETEVNNYGSMFSLKFKDKGNFRAFYHELLTQGVYLAPSEYEANFISFAHSRQDIQKTARAITKAFSILNHR
jgi:glutamate-1-semialdehyde 2,1-aminomutase